MVEFDDKEKKKNYIIGCDIKFDEELTQEEAEKRFSEAMRNIGVTDRRGGIY